MNIAIKQQPVSTNVEGSTVNMSFWKITLWFVAFYAIPKFYSLIILFGSYYVDQGSAVTSEGFQLWVQTANVLLIGSLLTFLLTVPLISKVTIGASWQERCQWLEIHKIKAGKLFVFGSGLAGLYFLFHWLNVVFNVPSEPFMKFLKVELFNSPYLVLLLSACVLGPLIEEVMYRGWLYQRLLNKQVNEYLVIVLTSMLFAVIHAQYEHSLTFFAIFSYGCFLAVVRSKTRNLSYSIVLHMLYNTALLVHLFFFS